MPLLTLLTGAALLGAPPAAPAQATDTACQVLEPRNVPIHGRKSPLDSLTFSVAARAVKLCYGRPSSRGRVMLGGKDVPYGKLWRTGANEPTIFFTPVALTVAGIKVAPGAYSLYTVPTATDWEIIVNRSTTQWGEESNYTDAVQKQELGRAKVKAEPLATPVETFTIKPEPAAGEAKALVLEWEKTRVRLPLGK